MNLEELARLIKPLDVQGPWRSRIAALAHDSRRVTPGAAFFALKGAAVDGHAFIDRAVAAGARVIIGEQRLAPRGVTYLQVADSRLALALAAQAFHGHPSQALTLIGVTGTSGKTSVTYALESILTRAGLAAGVIGTVDYRFNGTSVPAPTTTPESLELAATLAGWLTQGAKAVVMEVSSHALVQHRVSGCRFTASAFTNLSRDHLDYHTDMEDYFQAKSRLFSAGLTSGRVLINVDDPYGRRLLDDLGGRALTFGLDREADITARRATMDDSGIRASIVIPGAELDIASPLLGRINLANMLTAAGLAHIVGIAPQHIQAGLNGLPVVPGRLENVGRAFGRQVVVDYSHKVEALAKALETVRDLTSGRVITVFGCGGDRDRGKRPMMARAAAEGSGMVIVTSDNPRTEDPEAIIRMILPGFEGTGYSRFEPEGDRLPTGDGLYATVADRRAAIRLAVRAADEKDTVVIAGKGHEDYQVIGTAKIHLDDREEAVRALEELGLEAADAV